jgi:hypothetical protein
MLTGLVPSVDDSTQSAVGHAINLTHSRLLDGIRGDITPSANVTTGPTFNVLRVDGLRMMAASATVGVVHMTTVVSRYQIVVRNIEAFVNISSCASSTMFYSNGLGSPALAADGTVGIGNVFWTSVSANWSSTKCNGVTSDSGVFVVNQGLHVGLPIHLLNITATLETPSKARLIAISGGATFAAIVMRDWRATARGGMDGEAVVAGVSGTAVIDNSGGKIWGPGSLNPTLSAPTLHATNVNVTGVVAGSVVSFRVPTVGYRVVNSTFVLRGLRMRYTCAFVHSCARRCCRSKHHLARGRVLPRHPHTDTGVREYC